MIGSLAQSGLAAAAAATWSSTSIVGAPEATWAAERSPIVLSAVAPLVRPHVGVRVPQVFVPAKLHPNSRYAKLTLDDFPSVRDFPANVLHELRHAPAGELDVQPPAREFLTWMIEQGVPDVILAHAIFMATVEDLGLSLRDLGDHAAVVEPIDYWHELETKTVARVNDPKSGVSYLKDHVEIMLARIRDQLETYPYAALARQGARLTCHFGNLREFYHEMDPVTVHLRDTMNAFTIAAPCWIVDKGLDGECLLTFYFPSPLITNMAFLSKGRRQSPFLYGYGPDAGMFSAEEYIRANIHDRTAVTPFLRATVVDETPHPVHAVSATKHDFEFHGDHNTGSVEVGNGFYAGLIADRLIAAAPADLEAEVTAHLEKLINLSDVYHIMPFHERCREVYIPRITSTLILIRERTNNNVEALRAFRTALTEIKDELMLHFGDPMYCECITNRLDETIETLPA